MRAYALFMAGITESDRSTRGPGGAVARPRALPRRPGVRRRDQRRDAGVHRAAPRPGAGALVRAAGLRGVRPPLPARLVATRPTGGCSRRCRRAMIFDDHDIRDDWNTSWTWRQDMEATSWWHDRIVGGLASYWVHQHLGNLGPEERARGRAVEADLGVRRARRARRQRRARRPGRPRRPAPGDLPVELLPRLRHPGPAGRRRLTGGAGPRARATARCSTTAS